MYRERRGAISGAQIKQTNHHHSSFYYTKVVRYLQSYTVGKATHKTEGNLETLAPGDFPNKSHKNKKITVKKGLKHSNY